MPGPTVISVLALRAEVPYHFAHMRAAVALIVALGASAIAHADSTAYPPLVVWGNAPPAEKLPAGSIALAPISHTLFLNQCTGGCTVLRGADDARSDHSSIPAGTVVLSAWNQGDAKWQQLVQCVKDTFIPFNVDVVTTDPGTAAHHEVMVTGGSSTQLRSTL